MSKTIISVFIFLIISSQCTFAETESFWCWLADFRGCAGVSPESGNARTLNNTGANGIGNIGGKRDRVETRTIITIPDYTIRKIRRFFGLGGNIINISYTDSSNQECYEQSHTAPRIENSLLATGNISQCLEALDSDLKDIPRGIELNIVQCQQFFCTPKFINKFEAYLKGLPQYTVTNINQFLTCDIGSIEI